MYCTVPITTPVLVISCVSLVFGLVVAALGQAEIENLHVAARSQHHVGGLDVAMDDAFGVRSIRARRPPDRDGRMSSTRQRSFGDASLSGSPSTYSMARNQCHRFHRFLDVGDVGMTKAEARRASCRKRSKRSGSCANSCGQDLERNVAAEPCHRAPERPRPCRPPRVLRGCGSGRCSQALAAPSGAKDVVRRVIVCRTGVRRISGRPTVARQISVRQL